MTTRTPSFCNVLRFYGYPVYADVGGNRYRGTYISQPQADSALHSSGLNKGDVILSINDRVAESPAIADSIVQSLAGQSIRVRYATRSGGTLRMGKMNTDWGKLGNLSVGSMGTQTYSQMAPGAKRAASHESIDELETYMLQLINNDRSANSGIARVKRSNSLSSVARAYAEDMCKRGFTGHYDPEGRGPRERAVAAGITQPVSENLAFYCDPRATLKQMVAKCQANMMNEPKDDPRNHRGAILNPSHQVVGLGAARRKDGGIMIVQEFSVHDIP